jgi:hypothetical protein
VAAQAPLGLLTPYGLLTIGPRGAGFTGAPREALVAFHGQHSKEVKPPPQQTLPSRRFCPSALPATEVYPCIMEQEEQPECHDSPSTCFGCLSPQNIYLTNRNIMIQSPPVMVAPPTGRVGSCSTAMKKVRIVILGFGTARQKRVLE